MFRWKALFNTPGRRKQSAFFRALTECTESIHHETGATVAVVLRGSSGGYLDVAFLFGTVVSWLGLMLILYLPHPIHPYLVPVDVILLFILGSWFCARTRLRAWLTPQRRQRHQVKTAAHAAFFEEGVAHARNDNGVLVYWSRLERRVEVVAGAGVLTAVPVNEWHARVLALRGAARHAKSGAAFLTQLRLLGQLLARHLPHDDTTRQPQPLVGRSEP